MNGENPNNLKHYIWKLTIKDIQEVLRHDRSNILKKIPQKESQKAKHIIRLMSVLEKHGPQNTTQIKNKSGLSWNSVIRTLKLLESKKIIHKIQKEDKKNNEKIHHLDKKAATRYYVSLLMWKRRDDKIFKKTKLLITREMRNQIRSIIPENELEFIDKTELHKFTFHKNTEKKLFDAVFMKIALLYYFVKGFYCRKCFLEKHVVEVIRVEDLITTCPRCGNEDSYNEEISIKPNTKIKYRKNMVDYKVKKILKSYGM